MDKRIKALVAELKQEATRASIDQLVVEIESEGSCWLETLERFTELAEDHASLETELATFRQMVIDEMATDLWELKSLLESGLFGEWSELDLPTFGGGEPRDTYALVSWDDEQALCGAWPEEMWIDPR